MRIEFSYTLEDFNEELIPERDADEPRTYYRRRLPKLLFWVAILLILGAMADVTNFDSPRHGISGGNPPQDLTLELLTSAFPALLLCLALRAAVLNHRRRLHAARSSQQQTDDQANEAARAAITVLFWVAFGVFLFLINGKFPLIWHPTRKETIWVAVFPWIFAFVWLATAAWRDSRWEAHNLWLRPRWQRPQVLELDEHGYHMTDPVRRVSFAWACFTRVRETQNLLVLRDEDGQPHLIPKRAFADPTDVERCRVLLQHMIPNSKFLVRSTAPPKPVLAAPQDPGTAPSA